ncbi:hypothetical protein GR11A_00039 [Vibrio phage vB_VcorM_GR11A]|nr:hypothetical protein GR11A_00039 [Vibrio phage vB_VcorM_GR11A]
MTKNANNFKHVEKAHKAIAKADKKKAEQDKVLADMSVFNMSLSLRAEDALYFDVKKPSTGRSLKDDGYQAFASAPKAGFIPNFKKLAEADGDIFGALGLASAGLDKSQLRILSVIINNMAMIKNHGLDFGQEVYINLSAPLVEYLDCFYKAYVIGVDSAKPDSHVHICSNIDTLNSKKGIIISVPRECLINAKDFKKLAKKLKKEDKLTTPKKQRKALMWEREDLGKASEKNDITDVPTIDSVPTDWLDNRAVDNLDPRAKDKKGSKKSNKKKSGKANSKAPNKKGKADKPKAKAKKAPAKPKRGFTV